MMTQELSGVCVQFIYPPEEFNEQDDLSAALQVQLFTTYLA